MGEAEATVAGRAAETPSLLYIIIYDKLPKSHQAYTSVALQARQTSSPFPEIRFKLDLLTLKHATSEVTMMGKSKTQGVDARRAFSTRLNFYLTTSGDNQWQNGDHIQNDVEASKIQVQNST